MNDKKFIDDICEGEHVVQMEDVALCDLVQEGIFSPIYDVGRFVPSCEHTYLVWHTSVKFRSAPHRGGVEKSARKYVVIIF